MIKAIARKIHALMNATGRERSIVLSILTSTGNRIVGAVTQLIAFPIAVHALGVNLFGVFVMLTSVLAWLSISSIGIGPALMRAILIANAAKDRVAESRAFGTALWLGLAISALLLALSALVLLTGIVRPERVLGVAHAGPDEIMALIVSVLLMALAVVTSVTEGARNGYLEQYKTNIYSGVGSLISIVALFLVSWRFPTLTAMCLAVYGASAVARVGNMVELLGIQRPYLMLRLGHFRKNVALELTDSSIVFTLGQIGALMLNQGPTLIVGWSLGAAAATPIGVMMSLELMLSTVIGMITAPLWPAITDAHTRNDYQWIKRNQNRLLAFTLLYSSAVGLVIATLGNTIISIWLGGKVHIDPVLQVTMGLYFPLWMLTTAYHIMLLGVGRLWGAIGCLCVFAVVSGVAGVFLVPHWSCAGMSVALCLGAASALPVYRRYTRLATRSPHPATLPGADVFPSRV